MQDALRVTRVTREHNTKIVRKEKQVKSTMPTACLDLRFLVATLVYSRARRKGKSHSPLRHRAHRLRQGKLSSYAFALPAQHTGFNTLDNWGHKIPTQSKRKRTGKKGLKEHVYNTLGYNKISSDCFSFLFRYQSYELIRCSAASFAHNMLTVRS